jgi:hypothetical protein
LVSNQVLLFFKINKLPKAIYLVKTFHNRKELKGREMPFNKIQIKDKVYLEIKSKVFLEIKINNKFLNKPKLLLVLIFLETRQINNKPNKIKDLYLEINKQISKLVRHNYLEIQKPQPVYLVEVNKIINNKNLNSHFLEIRLFNNLGVFLSRILFKIPFKISKYTK